MYLKLFVFLLASSITLPVLAEPQLPQRSAADPRIKRYSYNENEVYRLDLPLKSVNALQFSDSEEVQSILIGDSASWEIVKLKAGNVVSVKPIVPAASTNMTIYTDRRVYTFELHSREAFVPGQGGAPLFRSIFTYPDEVKKRESQGTAQVKAPVSARPVDSNYMVSGQAEFRPTWVQDDGKQTSFFLPESAPRPAIFKVGPDRTEQLINSRTAGDRIIVDGLSDYWVLRVGDEAVCIGRAGAVNAKNHRFELGIAANAG